MHNRFSPPRMHRGGGGNGKVVTVCKDDQTASYRFGPPDGPAELQLRRPFGAGAEALPWPGIGRTIWEAVRLSNGDVTYEVYAGFDKFDAVQAPDEDPRFGGIRVEQDGTEIAHLHCAAGGVDYAF